MTPHTFDQPAHLSGPNASIGRRALLRIGREEGFTMIELLVSIIFIGVLFAAFSALTSSTLTNTGRITSESVLQTQVRTAVNELLGDLRQAYPPTATATSGLIQPSTGLSPTSLTFYAPDRSYSTSAPTSFHLREITYQLSGGNLQRAVAPSSNTDGPPWTIGSFGSWITRVGGITNTDVFTYYYLDTTTNALTATTDSSKTIVAVGVKLTVSTPQSAGRLFTYSDSATLRMT